MNAQQISDALDRLDDDLIEEANARRGGKKKTALSWGRWMGAAACLALAVGLGIGLRAGQDAPRPDPASLPRLPLSVEVASPGGMGYEGYMAHDISELITENPWKETDRLRTLPVYRNPVDYDVAGAPVTPLPEQTLEAMRARAREAARRLELDVEFEDNAPSEEEVAAVREKLGEIPEGYFEPTVVSARGDGVKIEVDADLTVSVYFEPALELPGEYNFGHHAPYQDMKAVTDYLLGQYRELLAMDDPQIRVVDGDYTYAGEQMYSIIAFDGSGDKTQRLLNYSFERAEFSCDDEGGLWIIRLGGADLSRKAGDYPVITAKAAKKLLVEGRYITNVPHEMPGEQYVKAVELVYLRGHREEYFMPYYRFLVELPQEERENGLHDYGAYYVPAVAEEYLTGLPVWEGSFN